MSATVLLSVVIPVRDEADAIPILAADLGRVLAASGLAWEACWVDDGSRDATRDQLRALAAPHRFLAFDRSYGKSAAYEAAFRSVHGTWIATLDGDGQDDPADLPRLLGEAQGRPADLVVGVRSRRLDSFTRRLSSRLGNAARRCCTRDTFRDIGCGIRVGRRAVFLGLPFFSGMHRFIPTLAQMQGHAVAELPVQHRPRLGGRSKYGIANRCWVGIADLLGVRWLLRRHRAWRVSESSPGPAHAKTPD
jgi:dolichol-phosphate mannosyltransferase